MQQIKIKTTEINGQLEEAYKMLRTNLQFCGNDKKVIAVTSCMPNEGKSTVSQLLVRSLAESGKKSLLIDADMRNSTLLKTMKVHANGQKIKGLSHYLTGQAELDEILYEVINITDAYIIFPGFFPPNPSELLESNKFKAILEELRDYFDYVIVDTPPLGVVIDGAIVASECDGAIIVIESNAVKTELAVSVLEQLRKAECPILGAVLNKVDERHSNYKNQEYYGRYYGEHHHY